MAKGNPNHDAKGKFSSGGGSSGRKKQSLPADFDPKDPQADARKHALKLTMAKLKKEKLANPSSGGTKAMSKK